jgi:hypothetical protein
MNKLYLYLGRRDKKGIKIIKIIPTNSECYPTRIPDVKTLRLSASIEQEIEESVHSQRMDYELWGETANSFPELKKSLENRGFSNIGIREPILKPEPSFRVVSKKPTPYNGITTNKPKTMMKKGKKD